MGRPLRIEYPGALYHISSRGNEQNPIFHDDSDRSRFLGILEDYHDRYGILIHSYVLMDNHYHLILETPRGNLIKVMHGLNSGYTGYFNRKFERSGHLFQGRYKAILVEKEAYLLELSRYVHLNPIRAGIVKDPSQYPWSSCPGFFWKRKEAHWVEYSWILSRFGPAPKGARTEYRKFLRPDESRAETPPAKLHGQVILGTKSFIAKTQVLLQQTSLNQEIVERKRLQSYPSPESVLKAVATAFDVLPESLQISGGRGNEPRKIALYLVRRYCGLSNQEVGTLFGGLHYSAVSKAVVRLEQELAKNRKLRKRVQQVMSNVKT